MTPFRLLALLPLTLAAQVLEPGNPLLPNEPVPLPVDLIQPVPIPEIPLGQADLSLPENLTINNQGGPIQGNPEEGIRFGGPVHVKGDNGLEIFANRANLDLKAKSITFDGDVSVYQGNLLQRGDRAVYHYETSQLDSSGLRASIDPLLLEAGKFTALNHDGRQIFIGENAGITTHDVEKPNFWVRSDKTTVYPGEKVTFQNLKFYAGENQIFWLPYLSQPLDADLGYHFVPGARSNWGPYLLNTYGIMLGGERNPLTGENEDAWLLAQIQLDLRSRRGVGTGIKLRDMRSTEPDEFPGLGLYFLHDLDPNVRRSGLPRATIDANRYQIELHHRQYFDIPDGAHWRFDTALNYLSDQYYLEDFSPETYRSDPAPDNTLGLYRRDDSSLLSLLARLRLNDYYRRDTHLPQVSFDQSRRPIFGLPLLHEGQTSYSMRGVQAADTTRRAIIDPLLTLPASDPLVPGLLSRLQGYERGLVQQIRALPPGDPRIPALRAQLLETGFNRFHTLQTFSMPFSFANGIHLTPYAGFAFTDYSAVEGPATSETRSQFHTGAEASIRFSKDYADFNLPGHGVNGLLHVIQPYANWSFISASDLANDFPKIDRLTFSTRPRPLDPSRFTAIDDLESWNILRLGARNRFLTRRDGQSHEWLAVDTYLDAYFDDPEGKRNFSNLYNDLRWQPLPWLGVDLETQFPLIDGGSRFNEINTRVRFMPTPDFEFALGYRLLDDHPVLLDSNRIDLSTYLRLSESWGIGSRHVFEMADNTLEVQQYTLHHDFGNWVAGMGITHRDNRLKDEFGIIFSLTLKDFSSISLPLRLDAE